MDSPQNGDKAQPPKPTLTITLDPATGLCTISGQVPNEAMAVMLAYNLLTEVEQRFRVAWALANAPKVIRPQ